MIVYDILFISVSPTLMIVSLPNSSMPLNSVKSPFPHEYGLPVSRHLSASEDSALTLLTQELKSPAYPQSGAYPGYGDEGMTFKRHHFRKTSHRYLKRQNCWGDF